MTASDISACKASSVKSGGHRQSGWPVLIGRVNDKDYTPSNGHTPLSLGKKPGMGAYNQACGHLAAGSPAGKPSPPAAQVALVGDLVAINEADKNAAASLTTAQADEVRGSVMYAGAGSSDGNSGHRRLNDSAARLGPRSSRAFQPI